MALAIIIMAAGKGTRMNSDLPKVLHHANGRPLIEYVLDTSLALDPDKVVMIIGHQAEKVKTAIERYGVSTALQEPQLGTGHAVMQAEDQLRDFEGEVLILSGDAPLVNIQTLKKLIVFHQSRYAAATVLTADISDPTGYGRVIRQENSDSVRKIRLYRNTLIPKGRELLQASEAAYREGTIDFLSLIDAQRTLLDYHLSLQRAIADNQQKLAELEMLAGTELDSI